MSNTNRKIILIIILILGVFIIPNNFIKDIIKNANDLIKYKNTVTTGEITADNGDGTYDVKIANAGSAIPNIETINYDAVFSVGEIVDIIFEHGNKESPKIIGHSKKIKQEPLKVEVDYSGGCAGMQTETVTVYLDDTKSNGLESINANYVIAHDAVNGDIMGDEVSIWVTADWFDEMSWYQVYRGFFYFDTSTIPSNATIISAIFSFKIEVKEGTVNLVIQDGQPNYPSDILTESDFNKNNYSNNGGQYTNISGLSDSTFNDIILNSNGRNWINKGGITKLCLRVSNDIAGITPIGLNGLLILALNQEINDKPKLTITYTI